MKFPMNSYTISFFEEDTKNNFDKEYIADNNKKYNVWYDKNLNLTLFPNKMNKKVYSDLIKIYLKRNIDITFRNYIENNISKKQLEKTQISFCKDDNNNNNNINTNINNNNNKEKQMTLKEMYNIKTPEKLQKLRSNNLN